MQKVEEGSLWGIWMFRKINFLSAAGSLSMTMRISFQLEEAAAKHTQFLFEGAAEVGKEQRDNTPKPLHRTRYLFAVSREAQDCHRPPLSAPIGRPQKETGECSQGNFTNHNPTTVNEIPTGLHLSSPLALHSLAPSSLLWPFFEQ